MDRWAVIVKETGKVSDIKLMEGVPPEINADKADKFEVTQIGPGVKIGMVRGGKVDAVDGFGFEDEFQAAGVSDAGATRIADAKGTGGDAKDAPSSHEKVRAGEQAQAFTGSGETPAPKAKPRRAAKRTTAKRKKAA